nr:unnamed protein product [Digitaria exilis]
MDGHVMHSMATRIVSHRIVKVVPRCTFLARGPDEDDNAGAANSGFLRRSRTESSSARNLFRRYLRSDDDILDGTKISRFTSKPSLFRLMHLRFGAEESSESTRTGLPAAPSDSPTVSVYPRAAAVPPLKTISSYPRFMGL